MKTKISITTPILILIIIINIIYFVFVSKALINFEIKKPNISEYMPLENWHYIDSNVYVYSAFWEHRMNPPFVKIIGIGLLKKMNISYLRCLLRYNQTIITNTSVSYQTMHESHLKQHTAAFFRCKVDQKPSHVALIKPGNDVIHWLKVHIIQPPNDKNEWLNNTVVCVRPFFGAFSNNNIKIAEFIAYYRILGANSFVFYDYQTENSLKQFLNFLSKNGIQIHLLPWFLPKNVIDTWQLGQLAAIADCVYRHARTHQYALIVDVDEFIVPQRKTSLQEILQDIINRRCKNCGTFIFRQTFFCVEYPDDPISLKLRIPLLTLKKTRRETLIWKAYQRSKAIVRPIGIESPGIHFTFDSIKSWRTLVVNPKIAKLQHYRLHKCSDLNKTTRDRSIFKYKKPLLQSEILKLWYTFNINL
ncbi:uncharacterized protein [Centruroides vittatus]|uniref:uncharacterized protein n=1 Tax=Centruroides vittatus TaxID=120091 RepID=UPI00351051D0